MGGIEGTTGASRPVGKALEQLAGESVSVQWVPSHARMQGNE